MDKTRLFTHGMLSVLLALFLAACSMQEADSKGSIISNPTILAELEPIIKLSQMNEDNMVPLMPMDLKRVKNLNKPYASATTIF